MRRPICKPEQGVGAVHNEINNTVRSRHVRLQHPGLVWSSLALHPEIDILWLHFAASSEHADELREDYGRQLDHFKNVIVEEIGIWTDLDEVLEIMEPFRNIQIIHIWLETNRYNEGDFPLHTREELEERARELQERDGPALSGRNWVAGMIDDEGNICGGFRATIDLD